MADLKMAKLKIAKLKGGSEPCGAHV